MIVIGLFCLLQEKKLSDTVDGQKGMIGSIDPDCEVGDIVNQAYENARFLCDQVCATTLYPYWSPIESLSLSSFLSFKSLVNGDLCQVP